MTMPQPVTPGQWKVTAQRQTSQILPGSNLPVQGVDVTFVTGHGVTSSVFVPYAQYTPDYVGQLIGPRAALLDSVSTLSGKSS